MILSDYKQKAFETAYAYWQRANTHLSTFRWRQEAILSFGFYDGSGQWDDASRERLKEREQHPMMINIVQGKIDSLSGVEIQSRYRSACRNDSGKVEDDELAEALTHYLYYVQQDQKMPYKGSLK